MANEEQVSLLKQGVEGWNQWREKNPGVEIDLRGADLKGAELGSANLAEADFFSADLRYTDLNRANLKRAKLAEADLFSAYLFKANLPSANLGRAKLISADLRYADLSSANLSSANLISADLSSTSLHSANLFEADLSLADLRYADLSSANLFSALLSSANLSSADFRSADLRNAILRSADLSSANLSRANLSSADLFSADLRNARLAFSRAVNTKFMNANLTAACIADWHINSRTNFKGVKCSFIYRGYDIAKTYLDYVACESPRSPFIDRLPVNSDKEFKPGEFEEWIRISAEAQQTIDITFTEGIDWQAFFQSLQGIRQKYPHSGVGLQAIEEKGTAFVIRLKTFLNVDQGAIESSQKELYESQLQLRKVQGKVEALQDQLNRHWLSHDNMLERIVETMANVNENTTNIYGNVGIQHSGSGDIKEFTQNIGNNLDEIGSLIQSLRKAAQSFPSEHKEVVEGELEDLEHDIKTPENHQPKRIGRRLKGLLAAGTAVAGIAGSTVTGAVDLSKQANDFTGNVLELAKKLGIELVQDKQVDD